MHDFRELLDLSVLNNTLKDYLVALACLVGLVLVLFFLKRVLIGHLSRLATKTATDFDDFLVSVLAQIGAPTFIAVSLYAVTLPLELEGASRQFVRYIFIFVLTIRVVLILQAIIRYAVGKSYRRARPSDLAADTMVRNISNVLGVAVWALGVVFILDNMGFDISALVAGLGIGGIAIAMAAQAILGDLFSAVSIFTDKPFEVGDFIIVDDLLGTVEYVGLKTTRIRSLHGEQLIFANSDLTKSRIKNYKRMEIRRIAFKIGVVYQTPADKVKAIPILIRKIIAETQDVRIDRVHFQSFGDFSLVYEIVYFVLSPDYNVYMDKQQAINVAIKEAFESEGIEFAYPTQMLYHSGLAAPAEMRK